MLAPRWRASTSSARAGLVREGGAVMELVIPIAVALLLVVVAWKMLKGLVKTVALVGILAIAAYYVFRTGGFG
jgi:hypothetical protein